MFACRASSIVVHSDGERAVCEFRCAKWACEPCAQDKRNAIIAQICDGQPDIMWTMTTVVGSFEDPVKARYALVEAWQDLIDSEVQRRKLKRPPYGVVIEAGEQGWPHMHVPMRHWYLDFHRVQQWMERRLGAHRVNFVVLRGLNNVAGYMAKYLGKEPHKFGNGKRYWFTRNWKLSPKPKPWRIKTPNDIAELVGEIWTVIRDLHLAKSWALIAQGKRWCTLAQPP
jgi:hypothetical protein